MWAVGGSAVSFRSSTDFRSRQRSGVHTSVYAKLARVATLYAGNVDLACLSVSRYPPSTSNASFCYTCANYTILSPLWVEVQNRSRERPILCSENEGNNAIIPQTWSFSNSLPQCSFARYVRIYCCCKLRVHPLQQRNERHQQS